MPEPAGASAETGADEALVEEEEEEFEKRTKSQADARMDRKASSHQRNASSTKKTAVALPSSPPNKNCQLRKNSEEESYFVALQFSC